MQTERYKNLQATFLSQLKYGNFIENYGEIDVNLSSIDCNKVLATYCGFYITTILDEYITKNEDESETINILTDDIKEFANIIASNNGNGYTIGELSYKDESALLKKIRNKMAHGDYIVEQDNVIFYENNSKATINIDNLCLAISRLDKKLRFDTLYDEHKFLLGFPQYKKNANVFDSNTFDDFCKSTKVITFTEKMKNDLPRTKETIQEMKETIDVLRTTLASNSDTNNIKEIMDNKKKILEKKGLDLNYEIKSVYELPQYEMIKKDYLANKDFYKFTDNLKLINYVLNRAMKHMKGEYQKFNYQKSILANIAILKSIRQNPNQDFITIIKDLDDLIYIFLYDMNNIIITTYMVAFSAMYQYGLENGLTEKGKYDLAKIVEGYSFDFSKLNLEELYDPDMIIEHEFKMYDEDIQKYKNKIPEYETTLKKVTQNKEDYEKHTAVENRKQDKIRMLEEKVKIKQEELDNLQNLITKLEMFYSEFNKEKYVKNINILEHVRNAIAHGNIYLEEKEEKENITNKKLIIKDYLDGKLCYEKKLKISEFTKLFKIKNFEAIFNFIISNMEQEELIAENDNIKKKIKK